jgi:hypothetical protein
MYFSVGTLRALTMRTPPPLKQSVCRDHIGTRTQSVHTRAVRMAKP